MPGTGPGQRSVPRQRVENRRVNRVRGHDLLPFGPLGVAYFDRDRAADSPTMTHTTGDRHLVGLELHPGAASVAQSAASQLIGNVVRGHLYTRDHSFEDGHESRAVRFSGSYPAQHGLIFSRR